MSDWERLAARVRQATRLRLIVSDGGMRDIRKRSDFYDSQSNEVFTLRTQIFLFLLDRKLLLYSTLLKTISISFLIVFFWGVNGIFLEVGSLTYGDLLQKNDICFATIHLRALKNSFETELNKACLESR